MKTAAQMLVVIDAAVEQQHRHRHVHGDALRALRLVGMQGGGVYLFAQELQGVAVELLRQAVQLFHLCGESLARCGILADAALPDRLGLVELRAHIVEQGRSRARRQWAIFGQILVQRVGVLDLFDHIAHGMAARDQIQHLAHGAFFVECASVHQRFHLEVDAAQ